MILDNASSHIVSSAKVGKSRGFSTLELSNMTLVFLPPNVTSVVQPLDQGIIASFKIQYKKKLLRWVLSQYDDATLKDLRKVVPNIRQAIMWSYEVWSELDAQIVKNCWRMVRTLPTTWKVEFALVDEKEKNWTQEESYELGALISKLQLGDDEMSFETYIQMEGEEITELELSTDELVDAALGVNHAQDFDLNVDLHSIDVDDVAPPTIKLSDAKRHASLLSNFSLDNSLHFGVNEIISFQKLVPWNLDKMTIANVGRQHHKSLELLFQEFSRVVFAFIWSYKSLFHTIYLYCLNSLYMFSKLILLMFL